MMVRNPWDRPGECSRLRSIRIFLFVVSVGLGVVTVSTLTWFFIQFTYNVTH